MEDNPLMEFNKNPQDISIKLNLLENGVDFILKGIDELYNENYVNLGYSDPVGVDTSCYKYGTLHLFSGFLLLLKERLSRHLRELIYIGKVKEVKKKLEGGEIPNTVDFDEVLERLEIGPRITFSKRDLKVIRAMQDYRNRFEHYEVSGNKYQLWNTVTKFLMIIDSFLVKELQIQIEDSTNSWELFQKIHNIETVWKRIQEQREKDWEQAILYRLVELKTHREQIISYLKVEYETPFISCPECGQETLIVYGEYEGICTNPEHYGTYHIVACDRCGEIIVKGLPKEINLCEECELWWEDQ